MRRGRAQSRRRCGRGEPVHRKRSKAAPRALRSPCCCPGGPAGEPQPLSHCCLTVVLSESILWISVVYLMQCLVASWRNALLLSELYAACVARCTAAGPAQARYRPGTGPAQARLVAPPKARRRPGSAAYIDPRSVHVAAGAVARAAAQPPLDDRTRAVELRSGSERGHERHREPLRALPGVRRGGATPSASAATPRTCAQTGSFAVEGGRSHAPASPPQTSRATVATPRRAP